MTSVGTMTLLQAASEQAEDGDCDDIVARIDVAETETDAGIQARSWRHIETGNSVR